MDFLSLYTVFLTYNTHLNIIQSRKSTAKKQAKYSLPAGDLAADCGLEDGFVDGGLSPTSWFSSFGSDFLEAAEAGL